MSSFSRQQLENWLKTIKLPAQSKCLDIGGSQLSVKDRLGSKGDCSEFKILDLETPHESKQKPDIVCDLNEYMDFNSNCCDADFHRKDNYGEHFDMAFCLEVSEYWWNPHQALENIHLFLKKGGILYISFHFVYMVHPPKGLDFLRYTPDGCEKLLKETDFEIIEHHHRVANSDLLVKYYEYDKMRGIKDNNINHNVIGSLIKAKKLL